MTLQSRRRLALTLTLALALVAGSPLWHHDHERAVPSQPSDRSSLGPLSLESSQGDYCPVCLTHRLLTHFWMQAANETVAPLFVCCHVPQTAVIATSEAPSSPEARAPPLC